MLLETDGLGKDYGESVAVHEVSLTVRSGEVFGLLGPNGAGKTTTISMIAGLVRPTRGRARIDGHDVRTEPFAARRKLGLVPQELAIYEDLSAVENLRYFASLYRLERAELGRSVEWAIDLAGLRDRAHRPVKTYSGGMKRRLNLVAGLVHRPKLVVLDEPTVGVDPQSRKFLFGAIERLSSEHGMAIVYTSHYMEEVQALCPRVAILDRGRVVAEGEVSALLAEHAEATLTFEYSGSEDDVRGALAGIEASFEPGRVSMPVPASLADLFARLEESPIAITRVSSHEADLERVFLNLTGHTLRDSD